MRAAHATSGQVPDSPAAAANIEAAAAGFDALR